MTQQAPSSLPEASQSSIPTIPPPIIQPNLPLTPQELKRTYRTFNLFNVRIYKRKYPRMTALQRKNKTIAQWKSLNDNDKLQYFHKFKDLQGFESEADSEGQKPLIWLGVLQAEPRPQQTIEAYKPHRRFIQQPSPQDQQSKPLSFHKRSSSPEAEDQNEAQPAQPTRIFKKFKLIKRIKRPQPRRQHTRYTILNEEQQDLRLKLERQANQRTLKKRLIAKQIEAKCLKRQRNAQGISQIKEEERLRFINDFKQLQHEAIIRLTQNDIIGVPKPSFFRNEIRKINRKANRSKGTTIVKNKQYQQWLDTIPLTFTQMAWNKAQQGWKKELRSRWALIDAYKLHFRTIINSKQECIFCNLKFANNSSKRRHYRNQHTKELIKKIGNQRKQWSGVVYCPKCPFLSHNERTLKKHIQKCTNSPIQFFWNQEGIKIIKAEQNRNLIQQAQDIQNNTVTIQLDEKEVAYFEKKIDQAAKLASQIKTAQFMASKWKLNDPQRQEVIQPTTKRELLESRIKSAFSLYQMDGGSQEFESYRKRAIQYLRWKPKKDDPYSETYLPQLHWTDSQQEEEEEKDQEKEKPNEQIRQAKLVVQNVLPRRIVQIPQDVLDREKIYIRKLKQQFSQSVAIRGIWRDQWYFIQQMTLQRDKLFTKGLVDPCEYEQQQQEEK